MWKRKIKKCLALGLAFAMMTGVAGCGKEQHLEAEINPDIPVFCVGIWQRSCQNVSVPHVVSYLSFSIYHKHLLLQYRKYKKQSCYDQFYEIVVLMEIYERNALYEW